MRGIGGAVRARSVLLDRICFSYCGRRPAQPVDGVAVGIVGKSTVVLVQNVSKLYRLYNRPSDRLGELLPFRKAPLHTNFWALKSVSFSVEKGEILGIVGPNGSGKSTLLQVVSGILRPTSGRVSTEGRGAAL